MTWIGPAVSAGGSVASSVAGGIANANSMQDAKDDREKALSILQGLPPLVLPDQDYSYLNYSGDYSPYSLGTPQAAQYQTISEDPATRAIQMQALQKLAGQANGAYDAQNQAEQFQALNAAAQQANARQGAIRQAMERRGQGGTGLNAVMQAQAAQDAANRAQSGTLDAVSKAALLKLQAQGQALQGAGAVRGQDFNTLRFNTDTINDFNRLNTGLANQWHAQDIANQNTAQLRNVNTRQDIAGRNTGIANSNIDRRTSNAITANNARTANATAQANALNGQASQNMQQGQMYNQLGQQGAQMFTNIGAGITAAQNANKGNSAPAQSEDESDQWWV
jgi:hypothetical protein